MGATSPAPIQMFPALLECGDFKFRYRAENGPVQAAAAVSALHPNLPIVGYESGDDIKHALTAGFDMIGDLRILVADNAQL